MASQLIHPLSPAVFLVFPHLSLQLIALLVDNHMTLELRGVDLQSKTNYDIWINYCTQLNLLYKKYNFRQKSFQNNSTTNNHISLQ